MNPKPPILKYMLASLFLSLPLFLFLLFPLHRHRHLPPPPSTAAGNPDPTRLHLLRDLHPAAAQQDPEPEAPPHLENPRLGPQSRRLFPILPSPPIQAPPLQRLQGPLRRGAGRAGGGGAEAGRGLGLDRDRPRPVAAVGREGGLPRAAVRRRDFRLRILQRLRPRALPGQVRRRDRAHAEARRGVRAPRGGVAAAG
ncbi:unnamed protein product [Linum tenue]|uniref:Uncharacterized protein n=1 Tax=Linum tenue TaxID=586396 RepID=A0AAV0S4X5_9ROSI|nr:unnamed protein product [Linum tenue]